MAQQEQALNVLMQDREVERRAHELLIEQQAQLEARISDDTRHHQQTLSNHIAEIQEYKTKIATLTEELETLKQSLANVQDDHKIMQGAFDAKARELSEIQ